MSIDRYAELDGSGMVVNVALADQQTATARGWVGPVAGDVAAGWKTSNGGQTWTPGPAPVVPALANLQTLQTQAQTALGNNRTYTGLASPSNAQVAAQVKALTQQNNGIIRLILNQLDDTN